MSLQSVLSIDHAVEIPPCAPLCSAISVGWELIEVVIKADARSQRTYQQGFSKQSVHVSPRENILSRELDFRMVPVSQLPFQVLKRWYVSYMQSSDFLRCHE